MIAILMGAAIFLICLGAAFAIVFDELMDWEE